MKWKMGIIKSFSPTWKEVKKALDKIAKKNYAPKTLPAFDDYGRFIGYRIIDDKEKK